MDERFKELADCDEDFVELSVGREHRVILNTKHGQIIIDVRKDDVNAFVSVNGKRVDVVLLPKPKLD
jgi:formylmethanofuran dehydrogenase subunit D